jgi:hypothetical protein
MTATVTKMTIMTTTAGRGKAVAMLITEPVATAEAETVEGRGCSSGNSGGRQQSITSSKKWGGGDRGGQEAPGKRREITVAAAVAVAAMAVGRGQR